MIYVYESSAVAECDKQLLKYFQQKIPGSEMTASEIYQNCDVAVMFGSWKNKYEHTTRFTGDELDIP